MAKSSTRAKPDLNTDDWFAVASDHVDSLLLLYDNHRYALSMYVCGLSAECVFRAFRQRAGLAPRFDHNLQELAEEAAIFPPFKSTAESAAFQACVNRLAARWENKHRFRSGTAMRRWLKSHALDRQIKGDYLKENARRMAADAGKIFELGVLRWTK